MEWLTGLFGGAGGGFQNPTLLPQGFEGPSLSNAEAAQLPGMGGMGGGSEGDKLGQLLRGVKAPAAPETQRLSLPSAAPAPRAPTPVKSGDLLQMLQLMGAGGGATAKLNYELPSTLGMALRGRN